jgi:hypothetical protein
VPARGDYDGNPLHAGPVVLWAYIDSADPRWNLLEKHVVLHQEPGNRTPTKIGAYNPDTRGAYLLNSELFVKRARATAGPAAIPDYGCTFQIFANADSLELATLGPLVKRKPGESVEHAERWTLHRDVSVAEWTDAELDRVLAGPSGTRPGERSSPARGWMAGCGPVQASEGGLPARPTS